MRIDLTDWAALLEALDGIRATPPALPPLPKAWIKLAAPAPRPGKATARRRTASRHSRTGGAMPLSQ
ncbi:hypothetical protein [Paramagnetospirillum marisnigri]|nr:hypothetical protein [Paramagnetospirillum marisnigri]